MKSLNKKLLLIGLLSLIVITGTACKSDLNEGAREDLVWEDYANDYYGIQYPGQWQKNEVKNKVGFTHPDNNLVGVDINYYYTIDYKRIFDNFFYQRLKYYKKKENITVKNYEETVINGHPGYKLTMLEEVKEKKLKSTTLFIYHNRLAAVINYHSNPSEHKKHLPLAMRMVSSLKFLDPSFEKVDVLTTEQALEDAKHLWAKLEEIHPDLYFQKSKSQAQKEFAAIKAEIKSQAEWTKKELYRLLNPFVTTFKDGHTGLSIYDQFKSSNDSVWPLLVNCEGERLFIETDLGANSVPKGSEILKINGDEIAKIISDLKKHISYERKEFAEIILEKRFFLHMWLRYGTDFTIEYKDKTGKLTAKNLSNISWSKYQTKRSQTHKNENYYFDISYPQEDVALLTINTFGISDSWFKTFVDKSFAEIKEKEIKHLIIDLRYNLGGKVKLVRYLYDQVALNPYRNFEKKITKYSDYALAYRYGYNVSYIDQALKDLEANQKTRLKEEKSELNQLEENKNRYSGKLYALTSPQTFSGGTNFATMVRDFDRGTIIGEETGGLASFYANPTLVVLPNSKLDLRVSNMQFIRPAGFSNGEGIKPDLKIKVTPKKEIDGIDQVLNETLELIKQKGE